MKVKVVYTHHARISAHVHKVLPLSFSRNSAGISTLILDQFSDDGRAAPEKFLVFSYSAPEITVRLKIFCPPRLGREEKVPIEQIFKTSWIALTFDQTS